MKVFYFIFCCIGKIEDFEYTIKRIKDNTKSPYKIREMVKYVKD